MWNVFSSDRFSEIDPKSRVESPAKKSDNEPMILLCLICTLSNNHRLSIAIFNCNQAPWTSIEQHTHVSHICVCVVFIRSSVTKMAHRIISICHIMLFTSAISRSFAKRTSSRHHPSVTSMHHLRSSLPLFPEEVIFEVNDVLWRKHILQWLSESFTWTTYVLT